MHRACLVAAVVFLEHRIQSSLLHLLILYRTVLEACSHPCLISRRRVVAAARVHDSRRLREARAQRHDCHVAHGLQVIVNHGHHVSWLAQ